ncbi:NAD-dependent deacylase [Desulfovibrio sp. OttesenSCG-928-G15]|nr:NAD-dependent deacylase [Desulfovibrio sp. OttesenSCG-928-G15]
MFRRKRGKTLIVVVTGAGISVESGLPTFRGESGLWNEVPVLEVATPEGFRKNPGHVFSFYNAMRRRLLESSVFPNKAHLALSRLQQSLKEEVLIVTQNIDDLHERAQSKNIVHMHGELLKAFCCVCECTMFWQNDMTTQSRCSICGRRGTLRPHVTWFGETPHGLEEIEDALSYCRLFLSIGTSGRVFPASEFAAKAKAHGACLVEFNKVRTILSPLFDAGLYGPVSETLPTWLEQFLRTDPRALLER